MCRVGLGVRTMFLHRNVVPGTTKCVDPGTCLTWQNHRGRAAGEACLIGNL